LEFTYVECSYDDPNDEDYKGADEVVTAAAFSERNDTLFLGTSLGYIRYINLQALVNINNENWQDPESQRGLVPRKPYQVDANSNMPITSMKRFVNQEEQTIILVTQNNDQATVYCYQGDNQPELQVDIKLNDLGDLEDENQKRKMAHMLTKNSEGEMVPYDFSGLKICNTYVAINSRYFCIGLVGDFKPD